MKRRWNRRRRRWDTSFGGHVRRGSGIHVSFGAIGSLHRDGVEGADEGGLILSWLSQTWSQFQCSARHLIAPLDQVQPSTPWTWFSYQSTKGLRERSRLGKKTHLRGAWRFRKLVLLNAQTLYNTMSLDDLMTLDDPLRHPLRGIYSTLPRQ